MTGIRLVLSSNAIAGAQKEAGGLLTWFMLAARLPYGIVCDVGNPYRLVIHKRDAANNNQRPSP